MQSVFCDMGCCIQYISRMCEIGTSELNEESIQARFATEIFAQRREIKRFPNSDILTVFIEFSLQKVF